MARGIPKSTREIPPILTMADTDEILVNYKTGGKWKTCRIQLGEFKTLIQARVDADRCLRPDPECDETVVGTGLASSSGLVLYDAWAKILTLPDLTLCTGDIWYHAVQDESIQSAMFYLTEISAPLLVTCGGRIVAREHGSLVTISMPLLQTAAKINFGSNASLVSVNLDSLLNVDGDLILGAGVIDTISLPVLATVGGAIDAAGSQTLHMSIPALSSFDGGFSCANNAIPAAEIDAMLIRLADHTAVTGKSLDFSGGSNGTPSGPGLAAKATLEGRGCTVLVN